MLAERARSIACGMRWCSAHALVQCNAVSARTDLARMRDGE